MRLVNETCLLLYPQLGQFKDFTLATPSAITFRSKLLAVSTERGSSGVSLGIALLQRRQAGSDDLPLVSTGIE